jgi:hypothetical protein
VSIAVLELRTKEEQRRLDKKPIDYSVVLRTAAVGGHLICDGGEFFSNGDAPALDASGANIDGSVYLRGWSKTVWAFEPLSGPRGLFLQP